MLGIQSINLAAGLQNGCGQDSIVDAGSLVKATFAIKLPGLVDDLLIYPGFLKLRQK